MKFVPLRLAGAYLIEAEPLFDERGHFSRIFCRKEFEERKLNAHLEQCSFSFNQKAGTLRGMHFQKEPHAEEKLVRCTKGAVYDVIVDMRPHSPTYKQWEGVLLTSTNHRALYVPQGFAHGFQTLEDETQLLYQISTPYVSHAASGVRYNDPALNIVWPQPITVIAQKDLTFATL